MKTNRDYISWSQYYLWNTSKKQFYKKYGLNEKSLSNKQFQKGKEFSHYKETGEILPTVKNPDMLMIVSEAVDELEIMEHKLEVMIDKYNLLAYIDSGMDDCSEFFEYKTGKIPWTQDRVNVYEQLDFYALCYYIKSNQEVIPACKLYWIETEEEDDGSLVFTGNVEVFERVFTKEEIVLMMSKIISTVKEIDEWQYEELELDDEKVNKYIALTNEIKEKQEEVDLIKLEILTTMNDQNVKYASTNKASFTISERATWIYSKEIDELDKKYKNEIKQIKAKAVKEGVARKRVSESLRFTLKK